MQKWMIIAATSLIASVANAGAPGWCKEATKSNRNFDVKDLQGSDPADVVRAFVSAECFPTPELEAHRAEIEQARTAWSKRLGMSEGDWADAAAWAAKPDYDVKVDYSTKELTEMTPIDQWDFMDLASTNGARPGPSRPPLDMDEIYVADVLDAKLSEPARMQLLLFCMKDDNPMTAAICADDAQKFDQAKLFDQLRADTNHGAEVRQKIRIQAYSFPAKLKDYQDKVAKVKASDPAWKKAFELAAKARTDWAAIAAKNADGLALAARMESAKAFQSRSMYEGCDEKSYAALGKAMSAVPAKTFDKMRDVRDDPFKGFAYKALPVAMKDPAVNLAAIAVTLCNKRESLAKVLSGALTSTPSLRGPRNLAVSKMADANLQPDDMNAKISWPKFRHPYNSGDYLQSAGAVIKSVKKDGDHLTVTSAPMMITTDDCVSEHHGNRIDRIHDDGRVDFELICDKMAKRQHDISWAPFSVSLAYEKILKQGDLFSVVYGVKLSDVIAVWSGANAAAPKWMLGGTLK